MAAHAHDASWQALAASLLLGCAGVAAAQSVAPAAPLATATAHSPRSTEPSQAYRSTRGAKAASTGLATRR